MWTIIIIAIVLVLVILVLSVMAISKGYEYKHTVDPLEDNPNLQESTEDGSEEK